MFSYYILMCYNNIKNGTKQQKILNVEKTINFSYHDSVIWETSGA